MALYDIAAYMYCADIYCPTCIVPQVMGEATVPEEAGAEEILDSLSMTLGVNRGNESSFDSDDFPKVVFFGQLSDHDSVTHCGGCGEVLA